MDHNTWQQESFYEAAVRVPFPVSWPARLNVQRCDELASLADLFGIATGLFRLMARCGRWKLIYFANRGRAQLFDVVAELQAIATAELRSAGLDAALDEGELRAFPTMSWRDLIDSPMLRQFMPTRRLFQFDGSRGVHASPQDPGGVLVDPRVRGK